MILKPETFDCDLAATGIPFLPVETISNLRNAFGPAKWTPAQQAEAPNERRTRVCKDCLRPGNWRVGTLPDGNPRFWEPRPADCISLANTFREQKAAGIPHNLVWGHGDPNKTGLDVASEHIEAEIDDLQFVDGSLWATVYMTAAEAQAMKNKRLKVSVRVARNWVDGSNRNWPECLLHLAIVDHPVIPGQNPFFDLAIAVAPNKSKKGKAMPMTLKPTVDFINGILPNGLKLPESVTEDNFDEVLSMMAEMVKGITPEKKDEPPKPGEPTPGNGPELPANLSVDSPLGKLFADLGKTIQANTATLSKLDGRLTAIENGKVQDAEALFRNELMAMGTAGQIKGVQTQPLLMLGKANNWDLSVLNPYKGEEVVDMGNAGKSGASTAPPKIQRSKDDGNLTEAEQAEADKLLRVRTPAKK